ncbi:MAG: trypsin-like peptidase domain-containing protein [Clostridiales bacterium]|nr:trypsin-like peptidase domain-containing protein [Clostridiales bacterium]
MDEELNQENRTMDDGLNQENRTVDHEDQNQQQSQQPNFTMGQTSQYDQTSMNQQMSQYDQERMNQQVPPYGQAGMNQQTPPYGQSPFCSQIPNSTFSYTDHTAQNAEFVSSASSRKEKKAAKKAAKAARKVAKATQKKKNGNGKRFLKKSIAFVSAAAVFGVIAGIGYQGGSYLLNREQGTTQGTAVSQPIDEIANSIANIDNNSSNIDGTVVSTDSKVIATDVSEVVENVMPSIVAINCTTRMSQYDFFGREYANEVSSSGSGIIIGQSDDELLVATNNHVVEGATALEIVFADDTKAIATVKGTEPNSDLAVVSVKMADIDKATLSKIRIATLGDSDQVKPGEMVIAIGNALGYGQSVTVGYVSALDREVKTETTKMNLLQTDAAINPGNSGGALINTHGEIIGINSVKYASTDVEGVGYAIPTKTAIPIFNELMNREDLSEEEMGYIGIVGKNIEESFANAFNMPVGISIDKVTEDSPADQAGLKKGEIIVGINGKKIETMQDLQNTLSYTRAGTKVTLNLKVLKDGKYIDKDVEVTLGKREVKE